MIYGFWPQDKIAYHWNAEKKCYDETGATSDYDDCYLLTTTNVLQVLGLLVISVFCIYFERVGISHCPTAPFFSTPALLCSGYG